MNKKLDKSIKTLWRINYSIWFLLPILIPLVIFALTAATGKTWALVTSIVFGIIFLLAAFVFLWLIPVLRYKRFAINFQSQYLEITKGLIWHKVIRIPYARVQNTFLKQGPLLRSFKLCYLYICTASRIFRIPGVRVKKAHEFKTIMVNEALKTNRDM